ncbi:MAG: hypothetical protein LN590_00440 [Rickettsia endosymbiont of Glossina mortisans submortisans]|nr:hypothetical protein [Rickettsia endosymbiont of Glossina mortisans submortisans]
MSKDDPAFLKIHYGRDGKLNKLSLPNTPIIFYNQWYPALTVYKGKLCSLPVNSGYYKYLHKKVLENNGTIEIAHVDSEFTIELLGE